MTVPTFAMTMTGIIATPLRIETPERCGNGILFVYLSLKEFWVGGTRMKLD